KSIGFCESQWNRKSNTFYIYLTETESHIIPESKKIKKEQENNRRKHFKK
ncbi:unnamed protein product, partial [Arabidopsis halleri]